MPEPNAPLSRNDAISLHAGLARSIVKDIAHSFAAQDIVLLPIKGVLLQQWVYDSPAKRPTTDIDLLIRRDDQHNAHRLLLDQGYRFVETCRSRVARVYQSPWGLSIDLHHRIFPYGRFAMPTEGIIQRSTYDTQLFDAPIRRMHALDLFAHMLGKLTGDHADLNDARRLQDMREIPQALKLDAQETADHLLQCDLHRAAYYVLAMLSRQQPLEPWLQQLRQALPRDPLGKALAWTAVTTVSRLHSSNRLGAIATHTLGGSLLKSIAGLVYALAYHGTAWFRR